jgi:mono/diheme cytochrome c family protein
MPRLLRALATAAVTVAAGTGVAACGEEGIDIASDSPDYKGAQIFDERCSACHSLDVVGAQGSAVKANDREYKDGPNFNVRKEEKGDVLYAIQNGGFSSGPMPQDIVVGAEAEAVAGFVAKYSGREAARTPTPNRAPVEGAEGGQTPVEGG